LLQVLIIGGSVGRHTSFQRKDGKLLTREGITKTSLPIFSNRDSFLDFCASQINPTIPTLALNFAYPLTPVLRENRLDGVLITGMKEHRFEGLVGKTVGEELEKYLEKKYNKHFSITVANDTICLLLSGLPFAKRDALAAGVIGTGINFAFFDSPSDIINTEAANFSGVQATDEAREIDKESVAPGKALFEKETAGGYLYLQYNKLLQKNNLSTPPLQSTEELDRLSYQDSKEGVIARELLERSAQLSAAFMAGITLHKAKDLTFVIEGSLFWNGYRYKEALEETLLQLLPQNTVSIIKIEESPLFGAAQLV
jgi:hexokinase